jgi:hypothetical protein
VIAAAVIAATTVPAAAAPTAPPAPKVWLGVFQPAGGHVQGCVACGLTVAARGGTIRALAPGGDGAPASGDVVAVSPVLGSSARGHLDGDKLAVSWFIADARDNDDGVLLFPSTVTPAVVAPTAGDVLAIKQMLLQREEFGPRVGKAVAGMELAGLDVDGDGRADYVATYGCAQWGDGVCQVSGQVFVARRGDRWMKIE